MLREIFPMPITMHRPDTSLTVAEPLGTLVVGRKRSGCFSYPPQDFRGKAPEGAIIASRPRGAPFPGHDLEALHEKGHRPMNETAPPSIRSAGADECEAVFATIATAFTTDPVARFAMPEPELYLSMASIFVTGMAGPAFEHGSAYVAEGFAGAALWLPPGVHADAAELGEHMATRMAAERLPDMAATMEAMAASHPEEPHWYLPLIGVDPIAQGRGIGAALMKHALARIDADGACAYLESSNPRNISLYERFGFERTGEIRKGAGPVVTPMVRPARRH